MEGLLECKAVNGRKLQDIQAATLDTRRILNAACTKFSHAPTLWFGAQLAVGTASRGLRIKVDGYEV